MDNVELIINDQSADIGISSDLIIALSYAIYDIDKVNESKDSTSKTITLPGTKKNLRIFGYAQDVNVEGFNGQKVEYKAVVKEGGSTVFIGMVNLKKVEYNNFSINLQITIVGNSREWINLMKDQSLQGLDIGGSHTFNKTAVDASEINNFIYSYGLLNKGFTGNEAEVESVSDSSGKTRYYIVGTNHIHNLKSRFQVGDVIRGCGMDVSAYNVNQIVTGLSVYYIETDLAYSGESSGKIQLVRSKVYVEDRPILFNVFAILTAMFKAVGYQIESSFINSTFFKKLFIEAPVFRHSQEYIDERYCKAGISTQINKTLGLTEYSFVVEYNTKISDPSGLWNTSTFKYTAQEPCRVLFKARAKITQTGTEERTAYFAWSDGPSSHVYSGKSLGMIQLSEDPKVMEAEADLRLETGDYIQVEIWVSSPGTFAIEVDETSLEAIVLPTIVKNTDITPRDYLPDIQQIEFLRGIRHLFYLHFITDIFLKKVYIEPRDDFYLRTTIIDLTRKVDISKQITYEELGSDLGKAIRLRYKEDSNDKGVAEWEDNNMMILASHIGTNQNMFAKEEETVIENPIFASTLMGTYDQIGLYSSLVPMIWGEKDDGNIIPTVIEDYLPRIFYFDGAVPCDTYETWDFEGDVRNTYPHFYSIKEVAGNENSLYFNSVGAVRGLFERYWFNYLKTINEGRKISCNIKLNALDIANFQTLNENKQDFRALYFLKINNESIACRLQEIKDYQPGQGKTTKCVLLKDVDRIYTVPLTQDVYEMTFMNDIAIGLPYASGGIFDYQQTWQAVRESTKGRLVYGNDNLLYGIGSRYKTIGVAYPLYIIERGFFFFDTSALPDGATVVEASFFIYKVAGDMTQEVALFGIQSAIANGLLKVSDFDNFGSIFFGKSPFKPNGYREVVLNQEGLSYISKSGWTVFCARDFVFDYSNLPPTWDYSTFKTYFSYAQHQSGAISKQNYLRVRYIL